MRKPGTKSRAFLLSAARIAVCLEPIPARLRPNYYATREQPMKRRTWTPPAPQVDSASPAAAAPLRPPSGNALEYARRSLGYSVLFGVIAIFFHSWFPLALGAFLFVADEKFIEWALAKIGIRFVPDTLGLPFIDAFVFFAGAWALITTWKDSAPAWLLPPAGSPWLAIVATAFACAVLNTFSTMAVKKLLSWLGVASTPIRQSGATLGLMILVLCIYAAILYWP
jgi:hypothetical protein